MSGSQQSSRRSVIGELLNSSMAPILLAVALVVQFGAAWVTYDNVRASAESAQWVSHSREVLANAEGIIANLSEAESAGRGSLISNADDDRAQFDSASKGARTKQVALGKLTLDNPMQHKRVSDLSASIEPTLELMANFVSSRGTANRDEVEAGQMLVDVTRRMNSIRNMVSELETTEVDLLAERVERASNQFAQTKFTLILSTLVSTLLVTGTYVLLRRHWRLQQATETQSQRHTREKEELARYNQRLLESTGEGIYGIDNDGVCTFMNRAGSLILGGQPKDFMGKEMHQLVHHKKSNEEPFPVEECPIYKASRTGDGCRVDNEVFWRLDGKSVPVEYSSFPLKDGDRIDGAVVTFNDISARNRSRQELQLAKESAEAANESKSQFLANMSHELRTPLNAVIMYSELLAEEAEDRNVPDFIPDLKRIRGAGKHLLELVNGVLDLSKVEAGKMELYPEKFNVADMVHEVASTALPLIEKNHNQVQVFVDPNVTTMFGDATKLRQVLYNLLSNASKFTKQGKVELRVSRDPSNACIRFQVIDTGIGMSEEQVSKLFQPFMQADASTTRKYGGTGLGLAIIKRFTEMMSGNVSLTSVLGEGTTFTVTVPEKMERRTIELSENTDEPAVITRSLESRKSLDSGTRVVLVIDDDPTVRDTLTRVLLAEGIRPITAADGCDGIARAKEFHPDLIILDVHMPKIDGWSVLAALKADDDVSEIPVIMHSVQDDRDLGFMLGASEYLVKPVDRNKLVKLIFRHMGVDNATILVIDDDEATRLALKRTMELEGWTVAEASNGVEGLVEVNRQTPTVILLDLMMPEMDGFEFLEQLHANLDWKQIHVVVLTAKDLTSEDRDRLNGGVERVLAKGSLSSHRFLDEVRRIVNTISRPSPVLNAHENPLKPNEEEPVHA